MKYPVNIVIETTVEFNWNTYPCDFQFSHFGHDIELFISKIYLIKNKKFDLPNVLQHFFIFYFINSNLLFPAVYFLYIYLVDFSSWMNLFSIFEIYLMLYNYL